MKPLKRRWMTTMIAIVPKAKPRASKVAEAFAESSAALSAQATMSPAETDKRVVPMTVKSVPVTIGGKKRRSLAKNGATRKTMSPTAMIEPYMVARPVLGSAPGGVAAAPIAISGETAVKVTPWMRGSLTPMKRPMPADWMMVAMPQVNRSALMR